MERSLKIYRMEPMYVLCKTPPGPEPAEPALARRAWSAQKYHCIRRAGPLLQEKGREVSSDADAKSEP